MCGIFFALSRSAHVLPDASTEQLLQKRGPDSIGKHCIQIPTPGTTFHATFISTVLSLRGSQIVEQPLRNRATGSVLCWNGEAWRVNGETVSENDSKFIFDQLSSVTSKTVQQRQESVALVVEFLSTVQGPFSLAFYDAVNKYLYFGRDCLGRRSLLRKLVDDGDLVLSSVCDNATGDRWQEVEADGIYVVDLLQDLGCAAAIEILHIPHRRVDSTGPPGLSFTLPFPSLRRTLQTGDGLLLRQHVSKLRVVLNASLEVRVKHVRESVEGITSTNTKVAILFSGGLDCTVLARMCHNLLPVTEGIDLLNVAFENPRIHGNLDPGTSPYELCPDRITARSSHTELLKVCPGRRWRLVEINVPYVETVSHRSCVISLMHPHNTEMDLSISLALYFASRGVGATRDSLDEPMRDYTTPAHVLLSGLGADELFGGYQRHATAYSRNGYHGLNDELALDFDRLGKRNLGRDDRVISHSSKEVRFPYLDEDVIAMALGLPVTAKCDFSNEQCLESEDPARCLEPGKRILRMLAWELGMKNVAAEKKRAIQFGTRTAKMETGKTKGTNVLS
ncbi:asparagine synthetase domain-containing protein 1 [Aaosphaeria arxii CBS 175.79]|uniref:Asparagine synthetase domain-containing protein 1 n=1 Tax=Aaosphaeria arxii CBS 175.79 TaxID=1450172 RepID=A0A6A5XBN2_9PLEO|nr:asparagine synthetase domain-containing protein 1 [Aaosphaeria arxii CBS 175.79]KAF2010256.1 asparagine synthetase domain-containing protein 1 [Aaosphaeria arxii CBS 175.79]